MYGWWLLIACYLAYPHSKVVKQIWSLTLLYAVNFDFEERGLV
jgi:hypothetical protein